MMKKLTMLFLIFSVSALCLNGQDIITYDYTQVDYDYYVSTTGSDSDAGTKLEPFLTLAKANTVITAGQSVWVEQGIYEIAYIAIEHGHWASDGAILSCTGGLSRFIQLEGSERKYFRGFTIDRNSLGSSTIILATSTSDNIKFVDCTFLDPNTHVYLGNASANGTIEFDGCTMTSGTGGSDYIISTYEANIFIDNCTLNCMGGYGFRRVTTSGEVRVQNSQINMSSGYFTQIRTDGIQIFENNTFTSIANYGGLFTFSGTLDSDLYFDNNTIANSHETATTELIRIPSEVLKNVYIRDNTITSTDTADIMYIQPAISVTVTGNTIDHNCIRNTISSQVNINPYGSTITATITGNTIYARNEHGYNIAVGSEVTGSNDDKVTSIISDNEIYSAYYYDDTSIGIVHSLFIGFNKDYTVSNNKVSGGGLGVVLKHDGSAQNGTVRGNKYTDCGTAYRIKGVSDVVITYDTAIATKSYCTKLIYVTENDDPTGSGYNSTGFDFQNCVLYLGSGITISNWIWIDSFSSSGETLDYNTVGGVSDNPAYYYNSILYDGWSAITTLPTPGWEQNGTNYPLE